MVTQSAMQGINWPWPCRADKYCGIVMSSTTEWESAWNGNTGNRVLCKLPLKDAWRMQKMRNAGLEGMKESGRGMCEWWVWVMQDPVSLARHSDRLIHVAHLVGSCLYSWYSLFTLITNISNMHLDLNTLHVMFVSSNTSITHWVSVMHDSGNLLIPIPIPG